MCRMPEKKILVTFRDMTMTLTRMTLMLTDFLLNAFEVTLVEFRSKVIDIASPSLHHTDTPKFDIQPELGLRVELNIKTVSMLWEDLVESFLMRRRGS